MLYENYKNKVLKWVAVRDFILKYKFLIIAVIAVIIALSGTLLAIKGKITQDISLDKTELVYGETVKASANAIFSDVKYQHREKGTEKWLGGMPSRAGEYEIRAVAAKSFGGKSYGETKSLVIKPRQIDITLESSITYGELPKITTKLSFDDAFVYSESSLNMGEIDKTLLSVSVAPKINEIKIVDGKGNDVTNSYILTASEKPIILNVLKRQISIKIADASVVYDANEHFSDEFSYDEKELAKGDKIKATFSRFTDVGTYINAPIVQFLNKNGEDVTSLYNPIIDSASFVIQSQNITVTTLGGEKIYDGTPLVQKGYQITSGNILGVHSVSLNAPVFTNVSDSGENRLELKISDAQGRDVTHNYNIKYIYGTVTIAPRPIRVFTGSMVFTYDGASHINSGFKLEARDITLGSALANGHSAEALQVKAVKNVKDSCENKFEIEISDWFNNSVTSNYSIEYEYGRLTVNPRRIIVYTSDTEKIYDGEEYVSTQADIRNIIDIIPYTSFEVFSPKGIIDVGSYPNDTQISLWYESEDVTDNYSIETQKGTITVLQRDLIVKAGDAEKEYDGTELISDEYEVEGVADNGIVRARTEGAQTDIGSSPNKIVVGSVSVTSISRGDVTKNYNISYLDGTLSVYARQLVVYSQSDSKTYDGTPLSCTQISSYERAVGNDCPVYDGGPAASITNYTVGGVLNKFGVVVKNEYGEDVSSRYAINLIPGKLVIEKREITVTAQGVEKTYDGEVWTPSQPICSSGSLASGESLNFYTYKTYKNVCDEQLNWDVTVLNQQGYDTTNNYNITKDFGDVVIKARNVYVFTNSFTKEYDGTALSGKDVGFTEIYTSEENSGLLSEHILSVSDSYKEIVNCGQVNNTLGFIVTKSNGDPYDNGSYLKENYNIQVVEEGTLTINQRPIDVVINSQLIEKTYDGTASSIDITTANSLNLAYGDRAEFALIKSYLNAGEYIIQENDIAFNVYNLYGEEVTDNYLPNITFDGSLALKINKRQIWIAPKNYSAFFDGEKHYQKEFEVINGSFVEGHTPKVETTVSTENVGVYQNEIIVLDVVDSLGNSVIENYEISTYTATFEILNRKVQVEIYGEKTYDGTPLYVENDMLKIEDKTAEGYGLLSGHEMFVQSDAYQINAGFTNIDIGAITYTILSGEVDVTDSYDIETLSAQLVVYERKIIVNTISGEDVYDGTGKSFEGFELVGNAVQGHRYEIEYPSFIDAGEYQNTPVGLKVFDEYNNPINEKNYAIDTENSVFGAVVIQKRVVEVESATNQWIYDGQPHSNTTYSVVNADGETKFDFVGIHQVACGTVSKTEITNVTNGVENVFDFMISDQDGFDVTDNYDVNLTPGTLSILPRRVRISGVNAEKFYDGTPLTNSQVSEVEILDANGLVDVNSGLIEGHIISNAVTLGSQTMVNTGSPSVNEIASVTIIDAFGAVVTENYEIEFISGTLTVHKAPITLKLKDISVQYDGNEHRHGEADYLLTGECKLALGHSLSVYTPLECTLTEPGIISPINNFDFVISDEQGNVIDWNSYYDITLESGSLEVTKRKIEVSLPSDYLSSEQPSADDVIIDGLTEEEKGKFNFEYEFSELPAEVGSHMYAMSVSDILDANGNSVIGFFDIIYNIGSGSGDTTGSGTVNVHDNKLTFVADSTKLDYNGEAQRYDSYTLMGGLKPGHEIAKVVFENAAYPNGFTDIGVYDNIISVVTIVDSASLEDVTSLYDITIEKGEVEITKRTLNVRPYAEVTYNGEKQFAPTDGLTIDEGTLLSGHKLYVRMVSGSGINAGTYVSKIVSYCIYDSKYNDVTNLYTEPQEGQFIINKRPALVTTASAEKPYDGTPLECTEIADYSGFLTGDVPKYDGYLHTSITNAIESSENRFGVMVENNGTLVTDNYDITYSYGTLTINKIPLTVTTVDRTMTYNGQPYIYQEGDVISIEGEIYGTTFSVLPVSSGYVAVGRHDNLADVMLWYNGEDATGNYDVSYISGTITIESCNIKIRPTAYSAPYNGNKQQQTDVEMLDGTALAPGHNAVITTSASGSEVTGGQLNNVIESVTIFDEFGNDVTGNYNIDYSSSGTFEITPLEITVMPYGLAEYDGELHYPTDGETVGCSLAKLTHTIKIVNAPSYAAIGNHTVLADSYAAQVWDGSVDVTANYSITNLNGSFEIIPRSIEVTPVGATLTYNGKAREFAKNQVRLSGGKLLDGHRVAAQTQIEYLSGETELISAGVRTISIIDGTQKVVDSYGNDVSEYYNISLAVGEYTINKREITVASPTKQKYYDGTAITSNNSECLIVDGRGLADGESITYDKKQTTSQLEVGSCVNVIGKIVIRNANGIDVTQNYSIIRKEGTLEIFEDPYAK